MRLLLLANSPILSSLVANGKAVVPQNVSGKGVPGTNGTARVKPSLPKVTVPRLSIARLVKIGIWTAGFVLALVTILLVLQRFNILRYVQPVPQQVRVTNVSSNSFVVSWTTSQKTRGRVLYTTDPQFQKDVLTAYDAKDKQVAQNKAYENFIETTGAGTAQINQGAFAATEIGLSQAGNYYTHFVLVENTKPSAKYYFKVDNFIAYWEGGQVRKINNRASELLPVASDFSVVTGEIESTLAVPNPSYGTVVNKSKQAVQDALAYAVIEMPVVVENTPALLSEGLASLVNNQGGYYFDFSGLVARTGEPLEINDDGGIVQYVIVESTGDASVHQTTLDKNAPVPEIQLTTEHKLNPISLQRFLLSAQAQSSGSAPVQDTSTGASGAYADRWNIQTVLHMGCVGGNNKLLGPQGCGPLTNTSYDVYVCQCGAFAGDAQYQASAYKANEGAAKAALTSADAIPDGAFTEKPCEPQTPIAINELKLESKVQRVNLSSGDFGVGLPDNLGTFEINKQCQDGSTKAFKVNGNAAALREKLGQLFNPKAYKALCLWKPMPFNGEEGQSLASCKDEQGKPRFPIPTNAAGQQVSAYEYGKIVCGSDGGESAAENCGFGTIADDPGAGGDGPTPTSTPGSRACGTVASGNCQLSGGGSTLGMCTDGSMSGVQPNQSPKTCNNGTFSWNGSKWVAGTVTPTPALASCRIDGVTITHNFCKVTGPNLYLCTDGRQSTVGTCNTPGQRIYCGNVAYTCLSSRTWSTIGTTPLPTTSPGGSCTIAGNVIPAGQVRLVGSNLYQCTSASQPGSIHICSSGTQSTTTVKGTDGRDYNCCKDGGGRWSTSACSSTIPTTVPPVVTPTLPPLATNQCSAGEYTRGWWITTHQDELYPCVLFTNSLGQQFYNFASTSVAHCSTSSNYNRQYENSGWYCNGQSWDRSRAPTVAPTDTPPPMPSPIIVYYTPSPSPTLNVTTAPTTVPITTTTPTPTPDPQNFNDQLAALKEAFCYDGNGKIALPYGDLTIECDCDPNTVHCTNALIPASGPNGSRFISPVDAQETANLIVSDKGYYIVPRSSGVYEITIPNKGKFTTVLRSTTYNSLYVDSNGNKRYDPDTDELVPLNIREMQVVQKSLLTSYTLSPGFSFVAFPNLFKDGLKQNNDNNYFYSRSAFLQAFNKDLPNDSEVTLLSRFANGSFDDTTVYRKDSRQTFNQDAGLLPGQGYVVRVLGERKIFKEFETFRTGGSIPLELNSGWNLVGVYSPSELFTASSLVQKARSQAETFRGQIDNVTRWENGRYDGMVFDGDKAFGFDFPLHPFQSYFLRVQGECDFNNCGSVKP